MVHNPLPALADHAAAWRDRPLPEEVAHHARRALIDWFAALLPGCLRPPAALLTAAMAPERGTGRAICYVDGQPSGLRHAALLKDRKSTRLNSSHANISYAVFCLKKKKPRPPRRM